MHNIVIKKGPKAHRVGLQEIALAAGVSMATVSRVLNGNNRVDPAIQKTVLEAAQKLQVDLSKRNKTKTLAFLLGNRAPLDAFHSRVLIGAEAFCSAHGWDILFLSFNYSTHAPWKELHLPKVLQRRDIVRAVVLAGANSENLLELLDHHGVPSVVFGNTLFGSAESFKSDVIFSDDIQGAQEMTQYLVGLGHRNIWFVGNHRLPWFARCFEGYREAMEAAGLEPHESNVDSEDDEQIGFLGTKSLLTRDNAVSAIFTGSDTSAHGIYRALRNAGLRIPDDVSVAGFDDTSGAMLYPTLTTIREFPEQLGKKMTELILDRIANPLREPKTITIPTEFIRRDSCRRFEGLSKPDRTARPADAAS